MKKAPPCHEPRRPDLPTAIVSRELGLPAIVGTRERHRAAENRSGRDRLLRRGRRRLRLRGQAPVRRRPGDLPGARAAPHEDHAERRQPEEAFALSFIPNGRRPRREEFIITTYIKITARAAGEKTLADPRKAEIAR